MKRRSALTPAGPALHTLYRSTLALLVAGTIPLASAQEAVPQVIVNGSAEEPYAPGTATVGAKRRCA
ncbi:hypothetical protein [Pseudoduganella plicata]|uniref:Uncharacterized protein n=1 Tax=Pseudoduganella plicata TaxID=321984 RepID=A0ABX5S621_9BURK|nr:hypothetical protein [Pseudoduganella plicata]QBQ34759.1 hypothetical protein E1742_00070 [Pseudoduganella plicata]